jgi:hypothetical protein
LSASKGLISKVLEKNIGENKLREKGIFLGNTISEGNEQKFFIDQSILIPIEEFSQSNKAIIEVINLINAFYK